MSLPVPVYFLNALNAYRSTPLFKRLEGEGRIVSEEQGAAVRSPLDTNIVPLQMSREELFRGIRWLFSKIYLPQSFGERVERYIGLAGEDLEPREETPARGKGAPRQVEIDVAVAVRDVGSLGRSEAAMLARVMSAARRNPLSIRTVMGSLVRYRQIRYFAGRYDLWDGELAARDDPFA
jgi:hypothetical protein